jgi:hypothetical protein
MRKRTQQEQEKFNAAMSALRSHPAFPVFEGFLKETLEDTKMRLVTVQDQTVSVPNLQGRAQQLLDIIGELQRKN